MPPSGSLAKIAVLYPEDFWIAQVASRVKGQDYGLPDHANSPRLHLQHLCPPGKYNPALALAGPWLAEPGRRRGPVGAVLLGQGHVAGAVAWVGFLVDQRPTLRGLE